MGLSSHPPIKKAEMEATLPKEEKLRRTVRSPKDPACKEGRKSGDGLSDPEFFLSIFSDAMTRTLNLNLAA